MYQLENVSYAFKQTVLDAVTLPIPSGRFIGVVGPNGSGKTTLLRLLSGFYQPRPGGRALLDGQDLTKLKPGERARKVAVVTQLNVLNPQFKVCEMIGLGRAPYHHWFWQRPSRGEKELLARITAELQLTELAGRRLRTLSGGETQRVVIARALVQDTPVLLLDEPVNHLDIHHQLDILRYFQRLAASGRTVLVVLHDLRLACRFCEQLLVLDRGKIISGAPEEHLRSGLLARVFDLPEEDFAALLGLS
ncbi:MAG: ABC transporter ATP-binding protein [Candidatus Margulisbacteria bacterium]|jgi:iron complex transport system ATP-binding protein|nr:ABC transporter ATP-binding protein [Candidatus Margulisiibacteriota bacterium]